MKNKLIILFFLLFACKFGFSQYEFIENKGQWDNKIFYKTEFTNGAIFFEKNCLTFNFIDINHNHEKHNHKNRGDVHNPNVRPVIKGHAYKIHFENSNDPNFITGDLKSDYINYFISNKEENWRSYVKKFGEISYKNIYDSIDIKYYSSNNTLKYDIIVKPGANTDQIKLRYEGVSSIEEKNGEIIIKTTMGVIKEGRAYAYQIDGNDTITIPCKYNLKDSVLSFKIKQYDKTKQLIIDPTLIFSTYTGSTSDNWGFTATYDYSDNVYSGGIAFGVGFPVTVGAYQVNFAGGYSIYGSYYHCDVSIIKFNSDGTQRLYSTYLGGSNGEDMPHSFIVNSKNELVIMGTTGSNNFPTTAGCFDNTFNGGSYINYDNVISFQYGVDIFVSVLSSDGSSLIASTYVGGTNNDGLNFRQSYSNYDPVYNLPIILMNGNDSLYYNYADGARGEVVVDSKDNIYVGTNTFSSDFPAGINAGYQTVNNGKQEGIVFKMTPDLSQLFWSTYLGGSNDDAIFSLSLNKNEELLVTGGTCSNDFPTTSGAYNTSYHGALDAFVSLFSPMGNFLIGSTYFGSSAYDNGYFVRANKNNNAYICGQTKAPGSTLIHNANYGTPNSGQFIAEFNHNLTSLIRSTVFGTGNGKPNISISAFEVDVCNRIYLAGWGREWGGPNYFDSNGTPYPWGTTFGTVGMQITPDAIQSTTDGQDFYIMVLDESMNNLEYATFFGEAYSNDHVDGGTSRFDRRGSVIHSVCASCGGTGNFPVSSNAWSPTNNSTNCNNAVFKINIIENLASANFNPPPVGCAPYNIQFTNNSQGVSYYWDFGDGTSSTAFNPQHTYTTGGNYIVRLIVTDPTACNISDTIEHEVHVISPTPSSLPDLSICVGLNAIIGPNTNYPQGTTFTWSGSGLNNYTIQNPVASPTTTTTYTLIAQNICNDTILQTVYVHAPNIDIITSPDTTICPNGSATLSASSDDYISYWEWSNTPNFSNIISTSNTVNVQPSNSTTYYIRATESTCLTSDIEQVQVNIYDFNLNLNPNPIACYNSPTTISITTNTGDNLDYHWNTGENSNSITVTVTAATSYQVTVTSPVGCTTSTSINLSVDNLTIAEPIVNNNLCYGDCNGSISVTASGINPYSYSWSAGASGNSSTVSNLCTGNYTVTVTDHNGCTASRNATITEPPEMLANFVNIIQPICDGVGYGTATINVSGGTPIYNYQWSHHSVNSSTNNELIIGTNYITVTDNNNCTEVFSVEMLSPSTLTSTLESSNPASCYGYCDGSATVQASLGMPGYQYVWENNLNPDGNEEVSNLCAGNYVVTIIDAENCVYHQSVHIPQPDSILLSLTVSSPIKCFGETGNIESTSIGGTPEYSYLWNTGNTTAVLNNVTAGRYFITTTDNNGCTATDSIELTQPEELMTNSEDINMLCANNCNGSISLYPYGGTPPFTYYWSNYSTTKNITNLCEGYYSVTITDANFCIDIKDFYISNLDYVPELSVIISSQEIWSGETVNLWAYSPENGTYSWLNTNDILNHDNIPNPSATPESNTTFTVLFVSSEGCYNTDTISVKVKEVICRDPYIFVPNAFTPNGDGKNDYFKPYYPEVMVREAYFAVYDRWGNIVYESKKLYDDGWDGTLKGKKLSTDVYTFYLKAYCINGEEYIHKGNVTLLR